MIHRRYLRPRDHVTSLKFDLLSLLNLYLRGTDCGFYNGDIKVNYKDEFYYYSDAFVTCDRRDRDNRDTKRYDQGDMGLFDEGDTATFVNDTPNMPKIAGQVKAITMVLKGEEIAGDYLVLEVVIELDAINDDPALLLNVKGYIHIDSPHRLNLY